MLSDKKFKKGESNEKYYLFVIVHFYYFLFGQLYA